MHQKIQMTNNEMDKQNKNIWHSGRQASNTLLKLSSKDSERKEDAYCM